MTDFFALSALPAGLEAGAPRRVPIASLGNYVDKRYGAFSITAEQAGRWGKNLRDHFGGEVAIDFDHSSDTGKGTEAAAWIRDPQVEGDLVTAEMELTPLGHSAIAEKRYRYFSPTFTEHWKDENGGAHQDVLLGGAFTNRPKLRKRLPAITLSEGLEDDFPIDFAERTTTLADFVEGEHPRDFRGKFKDKLEGLKVGGSATAPGGVTVTKREEGYEIKGGAGLGHYKADDGSFKTGKAAATEQLPSANSAATLATMRSLRSRDKGSLGGDRHYESIEDYDKNAKGSGGKRESDSRMAARRTAERANAKRPVAKASRAQVDALKAYGIDPTGLTSAQATEKLHATQKKRQARNLSDTAEGARRIVGGVNALAPIARALSLSESADEDTILAAFPEVAVILSADDHAALVGRAAAGDKAKADAEHAKLTGAWDRALSEARVAPAEKDGILTLADTSGVDAVVTMLDARPKLVPTVPAGKTGDPGPDITARAAQQGVDEDRLTLHERGLAIAEDKKIPYEDAVILAAEETR